MALNSRSKSNCPYICSKSDVIDNIDNKVDRLEIKVDKIVDALAGSELNPLGLITAREEDHSRIRKMENRISYIIWFGSGGVAVATFLFKILPLIVDK